MPNTWNEWEGRTVDGRFRLLRYLGGSECCAVFQTERHKGDRLVKAAIKIVPAGSKNGEWQLSRWQQAAKLFHPQLVPLYEMGHVDHGDEPLVYAVMECAEENLAQVLPGRALTMGEAQAMLESVLDVLGYLHRNGFVHGHLKPANIMASGEELKVSSDRLYRAGESPDGLCAAGAYTAPENSPDTSSAPQSMSAASDVWSLGMTLVETLTQNLPDMRSARQQDPPFPQSLPEPFLDIARHCLVRNPQGRWTVAQIAARLQGRVPTPQVRTLAPETRAVLPDAQTVARSSGPVGKRYSYGMPIAAACALALAAILAGPKLLRHHAEAPPVPAAEAEQPVVPPAPAKAAPSPQKRPATTPKPAVAVKERSSKAHAAVPALLHPEAAREVVTTTPARFSEASPAHGAVIHQASPEVLQSARDSIRGTVRVSVKVNVDRSGNVEDAELESRGPSKYFSRVALEAAQNWKFRPPMVGGRGVLSTWTLRYEFSRDATTVLPAQELP